MASEREESLQDLITRMKQRKKELGLTNKELSNISGVSFGTLNKLFGCETKNPSIKTIQKLADVFGVSINGEQENLQPKVEIVKKQRKFTFEQEQTLQNIWNYLKANDISLGDVFDYYLLKQNQLNANYQTSRNQSEILYPKEVDK